MNWFTMVFYDLRNKNWKRAWKFFWQKINRGWDDSETWNLDARLSEHILPRLKRFKQINQCYPHDITFEEWNIIIDKMILALEWHASDTLDRDESEAYYEKVKEGIELFGKYFGALWW